MEQSFQLKYHGNFNLFEQNIMHAEERSWWIRRLDKEIKEQNTRLEQARARKK